jgi:hypothetical protein
VFGHVFKGLELMSDMPAAEIPAEWLKKLAEKYLTEEEKKQIEAMGGLDKLLETLRQRMQEQEGPPPGRQEMDRHRRHLAVRRLWLQSEGVRIGQDGNRHFRAVKVWDRREFKDLDDQVELGTRNIKIALRRLRKFARTGAPEELDLDGTIKGTAHKGYLDILMRPERHNAVKVLLFFDVGGSMDWHIKATEELFSAARTEFKHMEHMYFHNCLYEKVWKENRRRFDHTTPTWDVLHTYPHDYKVIFVGDAAMSPYEIMAPEARSSTTTRRPAQCGRSAWYAPIPPAWAQSGARERMGFYPVDPHDAPAHGRADVSADARRPRQGDAGIGEVALSASSIGVGFAWYQREDYPRIREIMVDRDKMHDTYDEWLADFERGELALVLEGHKVVRIVIDPREFPAWCLARGLSPSADARSRFTAEATRTRFESGQ